jgi:electron-transferring-flavoprotein dehydrogenase
MKPGKEKLSRLPVPTKQLVNRGKYVISLQQFTAWLGKQAEEAGVQIFAGFAGAGMIYGDDGETVQGVITRDMGIDRWGEPKAQLEPGMELRAKITVLGEGTRGSLAKHLIPKLKLDEGKNPQVYQLGCKEVWQLSAEGQKQLKPGDILHTMGFPIEEKGVFGGGWIYGIITAEEYALWNRKETLRKGVIKVDDFPPDFGRAEMTAERGPETVKMKAA